MPYSYTPNIWNSYDRTKTITENTANNAVITKTKMDRIEAAVVEASASLEIGTVTSGAESSAAIVFDQQTGTKTINLVLEKGETPTITVGEVTPGESFSVVNSGSETAVVLDFTYPATFDTLATNGEYPIGTVFKSVINAAPSAILGGGVWEYVGELAADPEVPNSVTLYLYEKTAL